jgi:hypothetical protein
MVAPRQSGTDRTVVGSKFIALPARSSRSASPDPAQTLTVPCSRPASTATRTGSATKPPHFSTASITAVESGSSPPNHNGRRTAYHRPGRRSWAAHQCPAPGIRRQNRASESRISSAVLVRLLGSLQGPSMLGTWSGRIGPDEADVGVLRQRRSSWWSAAQSARAVPRAGTRYAKRWPTTRTEMVIASIACGLRVNLQVTPSAVRSRRRGGSLLRRGRTRAGRRAWKVVLLAVIGRGRRPGLRRRGAPPGRARRGAGG